jgi:hypothetical protein
MVAGRNFVDRVVSVLPTSYDESEVLKVMEALFYAGSFTLAEAVDARAGVGVKPEVHRSIHANAYVRLVVELGSFAMEARRVRNLHVSEANGRELVSWEEQYHDGTWHAASFKRSREGSITFSLEQVGAHRRN